jgi:hypothetical protein
MKLTRSVLVFCTASLFTLPVAAADPAQSVQSFPRKMQVVFDCQSACSRQFGDCIQGCASSMSPKPNCMSVCSSLKGGCNSMCLVPVRFRSVAGG